MQKNVASQKWVVFAFQDEGGTNPGEPVTGDAANITANVRIDGGAANAVDDTNPTELEDGYYIFDITAAESNGDNILITPASSTANVNVIGVPGAVWTTPPNFPTLGIESDGDLTKVNTLNGHTAQTGDSFARLGAPAGASVSADIATVDGNVDAILVDTSTTLQAELDGIQADTEDIQSRLPSALVGGRMDSNVEAINNNTDAADKLAAHALETLPVTFSNGGSTTSAVLNQVDGASASATNDVYNGRILVFNIGTLNHQVAEITDYDGATTTATISAVTTAPTASHTARMV